MIKTREGEYDTAEARAVLLAAARKECDGNFETFKRMLFPEICKQRPPAFHREIIDTVFSGRAVQQRGNRLYAFAAPRGHGKSMLCSVLLPLWLVLTGRKNHVIIFSDTHTQAVAFLGTIKYHLEYNEALRAVYGDSRGPQWQTDRLELKTRYGLSLIRAIGITSSFRGGTHNGRRPDMIILDDLENDETVLSADRTRELLDVKINSAVLGLGSNMDVLMVGTILSFNSVLAKLTNPDKSPHWKSKIYQAIEGGKPIWPEHLDMMALMELKAQMGPSQFAKEYMNDPIGDGVTPFRWHWLGRYSHLPHNLRGVVQAVDLSTGEGADYFVHVTVAADTDGNIYLVDLVRGKLEFHAQADVILTRAGWEYNGLGVDTVVIEVNGYQRAMKQHIRDLCPVAISQENSTRAKVSRIISLEPWFQSGRVFIPESAGWLQDFEEELSRWRQVDNIQDDQLDALEMAIRRLARLHGIQSQAVSLDETGRRETINGESVEFVS